MINCGSCGSENRADRRFCRSCGAALAVACATCGALNDAGDRFCGSCGSPLEGDQRFPPPPAGAQGSALPPGGAAPAAERRLVSVLFVDLVGFTRLSADRDAEEVRELLGRYFDLARERIERYGGVVEKFIGDAVMAVWGTPVSHEDDAERAVRAALELVDGVAALGQELDGEQALHARAAVLTGEAAVTMGAVGQGMVAGDLVNTASRLQSVADPGQVLVGEGTYQAASSAIAFEPVGDRQLRGKELPVAAWSAVRIVAGRKGVGRSQQLEPPFVGRDDEFRLLKDLLHATTRESRARLVSVVGTAGIGKSRLAWELEKYVDGVVETIYWHRGRSPAYGEGVTFWAVGEMVRERSGIAETDGPDESRAKLRATLEEHVDDAGEREWMEPRLAALLGLEPTPSGEREELYAAWRRLFERISERGTVVLVFEELHWADDGVLDFIESLLEWSRSRPILVLTLPRPELLERRPSWGAAQRSFTSIHLEPLAAEDMELLLVGLVPGIPPELIRLVAERSEGVPLFAVEFVRMLIDQGRIVEREGRYRLVGDVAQPDLAALPESLHALIGARLDGLPPQERSVLQRGAVLGQSFTADAVAVLTGDSREGVEHALRQLVRKELLVLDSDPRSPERGQYQFVQSLIREVAYGRLARRDRASEHLAAARYFEGLEDPELAGVVASHYAEAHAALRGTPEAAELAARAVSALVAAADRAAALYNYRQAYTFLTDAVAIEPDEERRIRLIERAAQAAFDADLGTEANRLYAELVEWHRARGNAAAQAVAMRGYGTIEIWSSEGPSAAVRYLEAAREELAGRTDERDMAALDTDLARAYLMAGDFDRAAETIERAMPVAERTEQLSTIAELLASKGWAVAELGRSREALALLRGGLTFARKHGFRNAYFRAAMNLSSFGSWEDPAEAIAAALEARDTAEQFGYNTWTTYLVANAVYNQLIAGQWDAALALTEQYQRDDLGPPLALQLNAPAIIIAGYREGSGVAARSLEPHAGMADAPSLQDRALFHEVSSHVAFAARDFERAHEHGLHSIATGMGGLALLGAMNAGRAALWLRDRDRLAAALRDAAALRLRLAAASAAQHALSAGLAALEGRTSESAVMYGEAIARLDAAGAVFPAALTRLERAAFTGVDEESRQSSRLDAETALRALGASVLLGWLSPETERRSAAAAPEAEAPRGAR